MTTLPTSTYNTDEFCDWVNLQADQPDDRFFLRMALWLAEQNVEHEEGGPFGGIIVNPETQKVVGAGSNHVVPWHDPTAHAEMNAIRDACQRLGRDDLAGLVLYSSCECCPMCLTSAMGMGIKRIVFGAGREDAEEAGFSDARQYNLLDAPFEVLPMRALDTFSADYQVMVLGALGEADAVLLNGENKIIASAQAGKGLALASLEIVRQAGKHYQTFDFSGEHTLVLRHIPHPAGFVAADWAYIGYDEAFGTIKHPERIIYVDPTYEEMQHDCNTLCSSEKLYQQPSLPIEERLTPTEACNSVSREEYMRVFHLWQEALSRDNSKAY